MNSALSGEKVQEAIFLENPPDDSNASRRLRALSLESMVLPRLLVDSELLDRAHWFAYFVK